MDYKHELELNKHNYLLTRLKDLQEKLELLSYEKEKEVTERLPSSR